MITYYAVINDTPQWNTDQTALWGFIHPGLTWNAFCMLLPGAELATGGDLRPGTLCGAPPMGRSLSISDGVSMWKLGYSGNSLGFGNRTLDSHIPPTHPPFLVFRMWDLWERCLIRLRLKVFEVASVLQPPANTESIHTSTCTPATAAIATIAVMSAMSVETPWFVAQKVLLLLKLKLQNNQDWTAIAASF